MAVQFMVLKFDFWMSILMIIAIITLFLNFSLYRTEVFKYKIVKTYLFRWFLRTEVTEGTIEKILYRASGAGTNYFHIHYRKGGDLLKKTILVRPNIKLKTLKSISKTAIENDIETDGF